MIGIDHIASSLQPIPPTPPLPPPLNPIHPTFFCDFLALLVFPELLLFLPAYPLHTHQLTHTHTPSHPSPVPAFFIYLMVLRVCVCFFFSRTIASTRGCTS